jgi:hypothetical protein
MKPGVLLLTETPAFAARPLLEVIDAEGAPEQATTAEQAVRMDILNRIATPWCG